MNTFEQLGIKGPLLETLSQIGFVTPSPIQQEVIPLILSGADVVGKAQTGTGKTAAFGLPCIQLLKKSNQAEVLVMTPTRELAFQVADELRRLGAHRRLKVAAICGGKSYKNQIDSFNDGAEILVATPGRILDLLKSKRLKNFCPATIILDEADEMLNMGFLEDIQAIFEFLPKKRQTLLLSATMPKAIQKLIKEILETPVFVEIESKKKEIAQSFYMIDDKERDAALIRLFEGQHLEKSIIFCKTKKDVDRVASFLERRELKAKGLHGDMEQTQRQRVTQAFRSGECTILVATDVAARGLNVLDVTHVINYHLPTDAENYTHRIGRTGRAGQSGKALSLVTPGEYQKLMRFGKYTGCTLEQRFVPSKQDVVETRRSSLIERITEHDFDEGVRETLLERLRESMDLEELSCKLLSLLLDEQPISGPDKIGTSGKPQVKAKKPYFSKKPFKRDFKKGRKFARR